MLNVVSEQSIKEEMHMIANFDVEFYAYNISKAKFVKKNIYLLHKAENHLWKAKWVYVKHNCKRFPRYWRISTLVYCFRHDKRRMLGRIFKVILYLFCIWLHLDRVFHY